jgi:hypothetical protein
MNNKLLISIFYIFIFLLTGNISYASLEKNAEDQDLSLKGYISNKRILPIKLQILNIDEESFYLTERNLEDNSISPYVNLMMKAELPEDYNLNSSGIAIFIPKGTKFLGHISEIVPEKSFNRRGFFKVKIDKVICPNNETISLQSSITSKSKMMAYAPAGQIGKTTLGLLGGAVVGALLSYKLGGIPLIAASNGYSLAGAAAAGGLIGSIAGFASKGKSARVEPGDELDILPASETGLGELQQITCNSIDENLVNNKIPTDLKVDILSVKKKRNDFGEVGLKITVKVENNSKVLYKLNNFTLKDSQGKEYYPSFLDFKDDIFAGFPSNETTTSSLEYDIDHPKAKHWLILRDKSFNKEIGRWEVIAKK